MALSLVFVACSDDSARPSPAGNGGDGGQEEAAAAVDLSAIGSRLLGTLDRAERVALCQEETRRIDPCLELARRTSTTPDGCRTALTACQRDHATFSAECDGPAGVPTDGCAVSVDAYLACIDGWQSGLSCDGAGIWVAPSACAEVTQACPSLASMFHIEGRPAPCTPEESANKPVRTSDDIYGLDTCRPTPARFIVLGDSIAECASTPRSECAPTLVFDYLKAHASSSLTFENHAVDGTRVSDLVSQAAQVEGGPGHVFVWIYSIGNDLLGGATDPVPLVEGYKNLFDYFSDRSRFPGGATFLLNTQYEPYDQCAVPGVANPGSPAITQLIKDMNQKVFLDVAEARPDTIAIDHYPDFLGHGENADVSGCPYCGADNTPWVYAVHPTVAGYAHMAAKWETALDEMLTCPDGATATGQ
jgi:hypothetical protein